MPKLIFWDVDTQYDFMCRDGKLYVPDAEQIIPNLEKLTQFARQRGIPLFASEDSHAEGDEEISEDPDFELTYPPHCLKGTDGQKKIGATAPENPLYVESEEMDAGNLRQAVRDHDGEIIFRKQRFDAFTNPNVDIVLDEVQPTHIVVYGVAQDVCNRYAIEGFLKRGTYNVYAVEDAMKPIDEARGRELLREWSEQGVTLLGTRDVIEGDRFRTLLEQDG